MVLNPVSALDFWARADEDLSLSAVSSVVDRIKRAFPSPLVVRSLGNALVRHWTDLSIDL